MKYKGKLLAFFLSACMVVQTVAVQPVFAEEVEQDKQTTIDNMSTLIQQDFTYDIIGGQAILTGMQTDIEESILILPSEVQQGELVYPVTTIGEEALKEVADVAVVILPEHLVSVEREAFAQMQDLQGVLFFDEIQLVDETAFSLSEQCQLVAVDQTPNGDELPDMVAFADWMPTIDEILQQLILEKMEQDNNLSVTSQPEEESQVESTVESEVESDVESSLDESSEAESEPSEEVSNVESSLESATQSETESAIQAQLMTVQTKVAPTIDLNTTAIPMKIGKTYRIYPTITKGDTSLSFTYASKDKSVATVSSSGVVTAVAAGSTSVTVSAGGTTRTIPVTVYSNAVAFGVDVSSWNKSISVSSYQKAKTEGVDFVIIRAGYGRESNQKDDYFESNYSNAKAAGLDIGVYHYSYAQTVSQVTQEAELMLEWIEGKTFTYPVYYDIEEPKQSALGKTAVTKLVETYCQIIEKAGYTAGVYSSASFLEGRIEKETLDKYEVWLAHYGTSNPNSVYSGSFGIWQFSSEGRVSGLYGNGGINTVDVNISFQEYPVNKGGWQPDGDTKPYTTTVVSSSSVTVRQQASSASSKVGSYKNGAKISVYEVSTSGSWCRTELGWIPAKYLTAAKGTVVDTNTLTVYQSNSSSSSKVCVLAKGMVVKVYAINGNWYLTNQGGWVNKKYIQKSGTVTAEGSTIIPKNTVKLTSGTLNIRKGAGTSYAVSGSYSKNTVLGITAVNGKWCKTARGWVSGDYISAKTGKVVNTTTLNVRKSASSSSSKVTSIKKGTTVKIYAYQNGWYLTNKGGWVSAKYIKAS